MTDNPDPDPPTLDYARPMEHAPRPRTIEPRWRFTAGAGLTFFFLTMVINIGSVGHGDAFTGGCCLMVATPFVAGFYTLIFATAMVIRHGISRAAFVERQPAVAWTAGIVSAAFPFLFEAVGRLTGVHSYTNAAVFLGLASSLLVPVISAFVVYRAE